MRHALARTYKPSKPLALKHQRVVGRVFDITRCQLYLDVIKMGGVTDLFSAKIVSEESRILDPWLKPGTHRLRLEWGGKGAESQVYYCGSESVRLCGDRPSVPEIGYETEKD